MKHLVLLITVLTIVFSQSRQDQYQLKHANSLFKAGKLKEAKKLYKELYKKQPSNHQYYSGYKNALMSLSQFSEAIKVIEYRKMQLNQDINVYNDLATAYFQFSQLDKAFETWDTAVRFPKNNRFQFVQIANSMVRLRAYDKAIEVYKFAQNKLKK